MARIVGHLPVEELEARCRAARDATEAGMDPRPKTVLLPAEGGVVEYAPQSLGHYVGLVYFPC